MGEACVAVGLVGVVMVLAAEALVAVVEEARVRTGAVAEEEVRSEVEPTVVAKAGVMWAAKMVVEVPVVTAGVAGLEVATARVVKVLVGAAVMAQETVAMAAEGAVVVEEEARAEGQMEARAAVAPTVGRVRVATQAAVLKAGAQEGARLVVMKVAVRLGVGQLVAGVWAATTAVGLMVAELKEAVLVV